MSNSERTLWPLLLFLAPLFFMAQHSFAYRVGLAWDYPASERSALSAFKIYRSTNGGPFTFVGTVPSNQLSYSENGLNEGISYTYQATALGKTGVESIPSNQALYVALPKLKELRGVNQRFIGVTFSTKPGNVYAVETSSDLKRWRQITTVTATGDSYDYVAPTDAPQGFFRVKLLSPITDGMASKAPSIKLNYLAVHETPRGQTQRESLGNGMQSPGDKPYIVEEAKLQTGQHGI